MADALARRAFLKLLATGTTALATPGLVWARQDQANKKTFTYKTVGPCEIKADGYLTLMSGFRVEPRPAALVSFWGYGDIAGTWYSRPDAFYRQQPLVSKEEAYQAVGGTVLSESTGKNNRGRFYLYCRQQGLWT